jgi:hypothetical protein
MKEGLEKIAGLYGLSVGTGVNRDQLVQAITQRISAGNGVTFGEHPRPWYKIASFWVSISAVFLALLGTIASWFTVHMAVAQLTYNVSKDVEDREKDRKLQWQQVIVYSIIDKETRKRPLGISFDDIRGKYIQEVVAAKKESQLNGELDEFTLRRILTDLITLQQIYHTVEDKYVLQKALMVQGVERALLQDHAKTVILHMLAAEPGRYTADQLAQKAVDTTGITRPEYNRIITDLMSSNAVAFDNQNHLYNRAFPKGSK